MRWKLCSFWLDVFAYICGLAAIVLFFKYVVDSFLVAFLALASGFVSFICFKAFATVAKAAEAYLGIYVEDEEDED